jgi:glycine cleavage system regulatory protein
MTVIAKDRPGLVEMIAARIAESGGNWEVSRMCRLGGQFAGIVKIEAEDSDRDDLIDSLWELEGEGLKIIINEDDDMVVRNREIPLKIRIIGQDHPGIIRDLSAILFRHNANVEELHTELQNEPMSGYALFVASIKLILPLSGNAELLKRDLEDVAADLMVDLEMEGES